MLDAMRSQKAKKLIAWVLVLIVGVPFIFYYGWNQAGGQQGPLALPKAAEVNGAAIYIDEIMRLRQELAVQMAQQSGLPAQIVQQMSPDQLRQQVPDDLVVEEAIRNELLAQTAIRTGLDLAPAEQQAVIRALTMQAGLPAEATAQEVTQVFAMIAQQSGMSTQQLVDYLVHQERRNRAAKAILFPQARTSILELWQAYEERNTQYRLDCAVFRVAPRLATEEVTAAQIEQHYRENQDLYTVGEKRIYEWVSVSESDIRATLDVTDEDVRAHYDSRIREYSAPAVFALSQIILPGTPDDETPPAEMADIIRALEQGEDFGDLAMQHSISPTVELDRGNFGTRREDQLAEPVVEALAGLASGELTAPIHLGSEWHLYRLERATPASVRSFAEASPEVRMHLEQRLISQYMGEREDEFNTVLTEYTSFEALAAALNLPSHVSEPVDTDATYIPGLGTIPEALRQRVRGLEVGETLPEVIPVGRTLAVLRLAEVRERSVRPLNDSLRAEIRLRVAQQLAREAAEDAAFAARQAAITLGDRQASGEFFRPAAVAAGASPDFEEIVTEPFQPIGDEIAEVGIIENLAQSLYYSPVEHLSDVMEIVSGDQSTAGYVVWLVRERITPDLSSFYADVLNVRANVSAENQNRLLEEWFADQRADRTNQIVRHDLSGGSGRAGR